MKRMLIAGCFSFFFFSTRAQSAEAEQLLLDIEKLSQFKKILKNMYDGYKVLHKGYTAIKEISQGSFNLHKNFLDALLEVSPAVRNYKRASEIIEYGVMIVKDCKSALQNFREQNIFSPGEMEYISKQYGSLLERALRSMDDLAMVVTSGILRMSDDERLSAIDTIYNEMIAQESFLRHFNSSTAILSLQRKGEGADLQLLKRLQGVDH